MLPQVSFGVFVAVFIAIVLFFKWINILNEYERGVIFTLGRVEKEGKGPGLIFVLWPIQRMVKVTLRTVVLDIPPQDVITRDNVSVKVNAVVYFRVMNAVRAIIDVENYIYATSQLAQTTLRAILGEVELDDLLAEREKVNKRLQEVIDRTATLGASRSRWSRSSTSTCRRRCSGDRAPGRGGAREARQDHPRRRRIPGRAEARRGRGGDAAGARHAAAPLPADAHRDRHREELDDHLPLPIDTLRIFMDMAREAK